MLAIPKSNQPSHTLHPQVPSQYFYGLLQYAVDIGNLSKADAELILGADAIRPPRLLQMKNLTKKQINDFILFVGEFLSLPNKYSCNWSEIFYTRLIRQQNIFLQNHIKAIRSVIHLYIEKLQQKEKKIDAEKFLHFLNTHEYDTDGALIGLSPTSDYTKLFKEFKKKVKEQKEESLSQESVTFTGNQLMEQIINWSEYDDDALIGKKVKLFVTNLRYKYLRNLCTGDLLITKINNTNKSSSPQYNLLKLELEIQNIIFNFPTNSGQASINSNNSEYIIARFCRREGFYSAYFPFSSILLFFPLLPFPFSFLLPPSSSNQRIPLYPLLCSFPSLPSPSSGPLSPLPRTLPLGTFPFPLPPTFYSLIFPSSFRRWLSEAEGKRKGGDFPFPFPFPFPSLLLRCSLSSYFLLHSFSFPVPSSLLSFVRAPFPAFSHVSLD